MGNTLDQINMKFMEAGSPYTGIPTIDMKNTADLLNTTYSKFISKRDSVFTFKTFVFHQRSEPLLIKIIPIQ